MAGYDLWLDMGFVNIWPDRSPVGRKVIFLYARLCHEVAAEMHSSFVKQKTATESCANIGSLWIDLPSGRDCALSKLWCDMHLHTRRML